MKTKLKIDHIGIVMSCICIVHCLALPFILLALGMSSGNELWHTIFLGAAILTTSHAMYHSFKEHCKHIVIFFGIAGITLLGFDLFSHSGVATEIMHGDHTHLDFSNGNHPVSNVEYISVIGSLLLVATHLLNLYYSRVKQCPCVGDNK